MIESTSCSKERRLLLHVGLPKTGSTMLQLSEFPKLSCQGVHFAGKSRVMPEAGSRSWAAVLQHAVRRDDCARAAGLEVVERMPPRTLYSNEDFLMPFGFELDSLRPTSVEPFDRLDRMMGLLRGQAKVMILAVQRDPRDLVPSLHFECLKQGFACTLEPGRFWELLCTTSPWVDLVLRPGRLERELRARYPEASISLVSFADLQRDPWEALAPGLSFLGCDVPQGLPASERVNARRLLGERAMFSKEHRSFTSRRLLLQAADRRLPVADRIRRAVRAISLAAGPLRFAGVDTGGASLRARIGRDLGLDLEDPREGGEGLPGEAPVEDR